MPRIAIVCREVRGNTGTSRTVLEHSRRLTARGWEVSVVGERLDEAALRACGARPAAFWRWPLGRSLRRRLFEARADRFVARGFDLVHGHGDNLRQDVLSLHNCVHAAHEAVHGRPLGESAVGKVHERLLRGRLFRRLIANSALMKADAVSRFGVPAERVLVIHPGHDPQRFNPETRMRLRAAARAELGAGPDDLLVGLITSGDFAKRGVDAFIAAAGLLASRLPALKAVVAGKEARLGPYQEAARAGGLGDRLRFLPHTAEVERYYSALDVYAHPAHFEEFGQSVQEALACGVPVLCGAKVGASELMGPLHRSLLLPRVDGAAIAAGLERLAADPDLRARLAAEGPSSVRANTWDRNFELTLACYEELLKGVES